MTWGGARLLCWETIWLNKEIIIRGNVDEGLVFGQQAGANEQHQRIGRTDRPLRDACTSSIEGISKQWQGERERCTGQALYELHQLHDGSTRFANVPAKDTSCLTYCHSRVSSDNESPRTDTWETLKSCVSSESAEHVRFRTILLRVCEKRTVSRGKRLLTGRGFDGDLDVGFQGTTDFPTKRS